MQSFFEALLNAWWQGILLTAVVWLILRDLPRVSASTRLAIWQFTMLLVIALPLLQQVPLPEWSFFGLEAELLPQVAAPAHPKPYAGFQFSRQSTPAIVDLPHSDAPEMLFAFASMLASAQLLRVFIAMWALRRLKRRSSSTELSLPHFLDRKLSVRVSGDIGMPMALGFFRPTILLPRNLAGSLSAEELRLVLLHEAGHLQRRDDWIGLAERLLRALFAYQPAVAFIGRQIERERELACDDWVLAQTGAAKPYAETLTRVAEFASFGPLPFLANGSGRRKDIFTRLEALLDATRNKLPAVSSPIAIAAALMLLASVFWAAPFHRLFGFSGYSSSAIVHSNDRHVEFSHSGEIEFSRDDQDVATMSPGAKLYFEVHADGVRRIVRLEANEQGEIRRRFFLDGTEQAYDARAQRFFSKQLSFWLRDQNQNVPARVGRWVKESSIDGALTEIQEIRSEDARRSHLEELLSQYKNSSAQFRRGLKIASSLSSDSAKGEFFDHLRTQFVATEAQVPVLGFVSTMHSDSGKRKVLEAVFAANSLSPAALDAARKSIATIQSQSDREALLKNLPAQNP